MSGPIIFVADARETDLESGGKLNRDALRSLGIAGLFLDVECPHSASVWPLLGRGPGDRSGAMLHAFNGGRPSLRLGYYPDRQEWTQTSDRVWIGMDTLESMRPDDIARTDQISGHKVRLADGHEYMIPVYRTVAGQSRLPFDMWRDGSKVVSEVKPQFRELWEWGGRIWDSYTTEGAFDWDLAELLDYCTAAIALNYRFDVHMQQASRLIDSTNWESIIQATIDWPTLDEFIADFEHQKKSEDEAGQSKRDLVGANSGHGGTD